MHRSSATPLDHARRLAPAGHTVTAAFRARGGSLAARLLGVPTELLVSVVGGRVVVHRQVGPPWRPSWVLRRIATLDSCVLTETPGDEAPIEVGGERYWVTGEHRAVARRVAAAA